MALDVAIQMDAVESIDIDADSTFVLALEAQARGHRLRHYLPRELSLVEGKVEARARPLEVRREPGNHASLGPPATLDLAAMDVVLMRQDPPFDMSYITATHLLERIHPQTLVVNDPVHVRNAPEKLFVTRFAGLMPPTLISADAEAIRAFRRAHADIILKPLFGNGGADVFHVAPGDDNFNALVEMFTQRSAEPIVAQRYLAEVREGDKRIILIEGRAAGAINRVPAADDVRANMHVGARPEKADLSDRDVEICETIGPTLKEHGFVFVGIDVIGGYLTEINVTSPTGLQEVDRFDGASLESDIWDAIERRRAESKRGVSV